MIAVVLIPGSILHYIPKTNFLTQTIFLQL